MSIRSKNALGCFGDKEVRLHFFQNDPNEDAPLILLLHGVHGCASPAEGNKYGHLARALAREGFVACIAESSRLFRDREAFGDDRSAWAFASFQGKTFSMEVYDACSALASAQSEHPGRPTVIWGFSLGGILSILLAGKETGSFLSQAALGSVSYGDIDGLIVSGTGDRIRSESAARLALPVLDTLGDRNTIHKAASKANLSFALFFYGGSDDTFDEESSRRILRSFQIEEESKIFRILPEVDHSFRTLNGQPSFEPLEEMLAVTRAILERFRKTKERTVRQGA